MHRPNVAFDRRRLLAFTAAVVVSVGLGERVRAAVDAEARTSVRRLVTQIIEMLSEDGLDEGQNGGLREVAEVIDREADLELLGRLVLGRHWHALDEAQKDQYLRLFRQLMLRRFAGYLGSYTGEELGSPDEVFEITDTRQVNQRDIIVDSKVRPPDREPLDVSWRLRGPDDPVIIDVVVENVSLLVSQRSEFASVIERRGVEGLLAELKARLERSKSATYLFAQPSPRA